ncbi:PREDICTED: uncharacterized protein LOC104730398 [Camelina sativa]|uniref:Uncharacterized protein LOC104730398 n=1 Tax=Camelina sativa TaxID=90675 RepID=A0ABM0UXQ2_CAMSA|nr:PREDICTED: uncharacterized protein LOC104730398 [Camelina sativa]
MSSISCSRGLRPNSNFFRFYPYGTGTFSAKEDMREEVIRLGVDLSLCVAESMFLLCDDIRTLLWFGYTLWIRIVPRSSPVSQRLVHVFGEVYSKHIEPKNGVYQEDVAYSVQFGLIKTLWKDFAEGVMVLHRLVLLLRRKDCYFDDRLLSSALAKFKLLLKTLQDKLRSAKHVSEANGFAREAIESNISFLWKSLFVDTADESLSVTTLDDLFQPILVGKYRPSEIVRLPAPSPYILGNDFAMQELKEEVLRLGVDLSLHVAEIMFLLCDDLRTMVAFFYQLSMYSDRRDLKPDSPVGERLYRVVRDVYSKHIIPKKLLYYKGSQSVHRRLIMTTWATLRVGIRDLDLLVKNLRTGKGFRYGRESTRVIEESLKKLEEQLSSTKDASEAHGFARDAMESSIFDLWKSLFDKETQVPSCALVPEQGPALATTSLN